MKRTAEGLTNSPFHPALAFHREVLTVQAWAQLRRDFLAALQECSAAGRLEWREPRKLWRHSQEALGKWLLSQLARVPVRFGGRDPALPDTHDILQGNTAASQPASDSPVVLGMFSFAAPHIVAALASEAAAPQGASYDEQLIRDLVLKCRGTGSSSHEGGDEGQDEGSVVRVVQGLVRDFQLMSRCSTALAEIEAAMQHVTPRTACQPQLRRIDADDTRRTPSQQRMCGAIAEVAVRWPADTRNGSHHRGPSRPSCPPVSIPWVAYDKLLRCYARFGAQADAAYCTDTFTPDACRLCRVATVALRYEGGLATGSLQLCADTALKQHLHGVGYHVMDLCASPINAYMGRPRTGLSHHSHKQAPQEHVAADKNDEEEEEGEPNWFCSAFVDTDGYFGSLGSALHVDPLRLQSSALVNPTHAPLLLTLDVPYDEDLCQQLFCKLAEDMQRAQASKSNSNNEDDERQHAGQVACVHTTRVDYVLVLPLWWDLRLDKTKRLFTSDDDRSDAVTAAGNAEQDSERDAVRGQADVLDRLLQERTAPLRQGHVIRYDWPVRLAKASRGWVCFDGVFVGDSYTYFCTATNRALRGVTTTEVIGLSQPQSAAKDGEGSMLAAALRNFYD